jgi:ubiquinone/menaquinone biosynthesis C-methylase UbiE
MEWIAILKCPVTGKELRALQPQEIGVLRQKMVAGQLWQADGQLMTQPFDKGLATLDGHYIYPIIKDIILLLKDLAVVDATDKIIKDTINEDKQLVKNFYDQKGWFANEKGDYEDAVIFEDLRPFAQDYIKKCHDRVSRYLNPSGTYMVDAASGALQYEDYLQYSANYQYRVCVDFSFQALSECKRKLGDKALCILADMTNMPFKDNVMQGFVSLNTIYHIPKEEQATAIKELYRILAPKAKGVVVYEWFKHSSWMNFWMFPFRAFVFIKNRIADGIARIFGKKDAGRRLYYYAHSQEYMRKHLPPYKLVVWRSLSVHFMRYYLHSWLFGKQLLDWVYQKEEKEPERCGEKGEYPMLVFEK